MNLLRKLLDKFDNLSPKIFWSIIICVLSLLLTSFVILLGRDRRINDLHRTGFGRVIEIVGEVTGHSDRVIVRYFPCRSDGSTDIFNLNDKSDIQYVSRLAILSTNTPVKIGDGIIVVNKTNKQFNSALPFQQKLESP